MKLEGEFSGGIGSRRNRTGPNLDALRERFLKDKLLAAEGERQGIISWTPSPGQSPKQLVSLSVFEHADYGISLCWAIDIDDVPGPEVWSLGDATGLKMEDYVDTDDQTFVLKGTFIPVERALFAVEDFFQDPLVPSVRIEWVDDAKLPDLGAP